MKERIEYVVQRSLEGKWYDTVIHKYVDVAYNCYKVQDKRTCRIIERRIKEKVVVR